MKRIIIISTISLFISVIFSCKKDENITEPENNDTITNYNKPNGNEQIISELLIGNENQLSIFYELIEKGNGNMFVRFKKNNQFFIGEINSNGNFIWQKNINFKPNSIYNVSINETNLSNALLVVGNDTEGNFGAISLYDNNGNFISDKIFNSFNYTIFNSAKGVIDIKKDVVGSYSLCNQNFNNIDKKLYIVAGGAGENSTNFVPVIVTFAIDNNGIITYEYPSFCNFESFKLFENYPKTCFNEIGIEGDCFPVNDYSCQGTGTPIVHWTCGSGLAYWLSAYTINNNNETINFSVCKLNTNVIWNYTENTELNCIDITNIDYKINQIDWFTTIKQQSEIYKTSIEQGSKSLVLGSNNIFIAGKTDINKNAQSFKAGLIASLNYDGSIKWQNNYTLSDYSDGYSSIYHDCDDNFLYACGIYSNYMLSDKNIYGFGLISKISTETGISISDKFIGNQNCKSKIITITKINNFLFAGGYTNAYKSEPIQAQGWFFEYNHNGM